MMYVLPFLILALLWIGAVHLFERLTKRNLTVLQAIGAGAFGIATMQVAPAEAFWIVVSMILMGAGLYLWHENKRGRKIERETVQRVATVAALALVMMMTVMPSIGVAAQTATPDNPLTIDFGEEQLEIFFDWFNIMFNALLPIGLLGAALAAGGAFVFVVTQFLINAFKNIRAGG